MSSKTSWSRRQFITSASAASAAILLKPFSSWAITDIDPRVAAIVAASIGIDTHNHVDVPLIASEVPGPTLDLAGEMKKSGLAAICMTFAVDYLQPLPSEDGYKRFISGLDAMDKQLALNGMKRALSISDLRTAHQRHQLTVIQSVEGGHFLEGKVERLAEAHQRGLRHLGLLHDNDASVPLGDVFTNPPRWGGLTSFGADIIKECNRLGILIDLSHANAEMVNAALKLSTRPVIVSHTGLDTQVGNNANMARMMQPRLLNKEQAKTVANAGGVIGVWTHLAETPLNYAENIRALVDIVGTDHVCIGTDTKLTPSYRSANAKPGPSKPQPDGSTPPEKPNENKGNTNQRQERIGERTNLAWKDQTAGFYYATVDALLKVGFTADEISKIGGGNFCRVFEKATTA